MGECLAVKPKDR